MTEKGEHQEYLYPMRLQKFLGRAGAASRRGSERLISAGRVTVNGEVITELGSRVMPLTDEVRVDGQLIRYFDEKVTLMLNKPAGYLTTMSDPFSRPCVSELVPLERYPGLFPIGRLDMDTTGLLLFSTDGDLGMLILHPRHHVDKSYEALVEGMLSPQEIKKLEDGILLEDGYTAPAKTFAVSKPLFKAPKRCSWAGLTIHEGKKHQVKRMFDALGHPVKALHRSRLGSLDLGDLPEGSWRILTEEEVDTLRDQALLTDNPRPLP